MLDRRTLFSVTAAIGSSIGSFFSGGKAQAANYTGVNLSPEGDIAPRGVKGRFERIPDLDLESQQDFVTGFRTFQQRFRPIVKRRIDQILLDNDLDPKETLNMEQTVKLVEDDLLVQTSGRTWISNQQITWKTLQDYFHDHADEYFVEMEAADNDGPGTLELNPNLDIPKYIQHEIHLMPGGYVGDPFAGHVYHFGANSFTAGVPMLGNNEQDQIQTRMADRMPLPGDGQVKRILDMGCGYGRWSGALKERFPDAEVWGIDVGGPLVRFAHMRCRDLGVDVNFSQRLAEDTKFPDNHFDIVTSYIVNHEVPDEFNKQIIAEAYRVTRPGGYFYPLDFKTRGSKGDAYSMYRRWWDHRWNCEPWSPDFVAFDFEGEIEKAGFTINRETRPVHRGYGARHSVKIA
ncbi:MAG: class I SAM-dependent methyltransferase [Rhodospirillaceae bacterium]